MNKNSIMKLIKIVKGEVKGGQEKVLDGVDIIRVHYMQVWKYYNETLWYN
jgi:hypothetical protein